MISMHYKCFDWLLNVLKYFLSGSIVTVRMYKSKDQHQCGAVLLIIFINSAYMELCEFKPPNRFIKYVSIKFQLLYKSASSQRFYGFHEFHVHLDGIQYCTETCTLLLIYFEIIAMAFYCEPTISDALKQFASGRFVDFSPCNFE